VIRSATFTVYVKKPGCGKMTWTRYRPDATSLALKLFAPLPRPVIVSTGRKPSSRRPWREISTTVSQGCAAGTALGPFASAT
jgi:hypothetical protein